MAADMDPEEPQEWRTIFNLFDVSDSFRMVTVMNPEELE